MPLKRGKSNKAFQENVKTEMKRGRKQKQAVAIAYGEADLAKKRDSKEKRARAAKKRK
jgi:hypothetical protein